MGCIRYALSRLDFSFPESRSLDWCIGPPLLQSFTRILEGRPPEDSVRALAFYRERFSVTGLYENRPYDGIGAVLGHLARSRPLYVATSKPRVYAVKILQHFGLAGHFRAIHGSELDGTRSDKGELIAYLLAQEDLEPASTAMIGDREHDMIGARKNGVAAWGVTWGYGSETELRAAGAGRIFGTPAELAALAAPEALAALEARAAGAGALDCERSLSQKQTETGV